MANNNLGRNENYVGEKYLIENYKEIKNNIVKTSGILKNFGVNPPLKDVVEKKYYDTDDLFFRQLGVNISVNVYKSRSYADLVVRYDSDKIRFQFLSDIPDTFIKKIGKKDLISQHFEYIAQVILELIPNGISIEPMEKVQLIQLKLIIKKKRERYRIINSRGLKIIFSFEQSVYMNQKRNKVKLNMLELRLDSPVHKTGEMFEKFIHDLRITEHRLIKLKRSDLFIGQEYLDI